MRTNVPSMVAGFLCHTGERDPEVLFQSFAHYLLTSSDAWTLPVPLEKIRRHHGFQCHGRALLNRGMLLGQNIFVNSDDPATVQRFTEAHEMMESLCATLRSETPSRLPTHVERSFDRYKERWCDSGAAALLMPAALVYPEVSARGMSLTAGRYFAQRWQTSLTATMRRMLDVDMEACIFALLQEGHRKREVIPSRVGQGVLWGEREHWDPPAQLRVMRWWRSPQTTSRLCHNESFLRDLSIYQTLADGVTGVVRVGRDRLDLEKIQGEYDTESLLIHIEAKATVMTLLHLA